MQKTLGLGIRNAFEAEDMKLKTAKNYIGDPFPHFCQAPPSSGESNPWNCPNVVEGRNQCCVPDSAYSLGLAEWFTPTHVHQGSSRYLENLFLAKYTTSIVFLVALFEAPGGCGSQELDDKKGRITAIICHFIYGSKALSRALYPIF